MKPNQKKAMDYMFIGAHPDDIEINAGGTIAELISQKKTVCAVICTYMQETGRGIEAIKALNNLGVSSSNIHFLNLEDKDLHSKFLLLVTALEAVIKKENPKSVYTHFHADTHQDHEIVAKATMVAARYIQNVGMYNPTYPSGRTNIPMHPNLVSFFSEKSMHKKLQAISQYKSQSIKYGNEEWVESIKAIAKGDSWRYGGTHGYAELFQISRTTNV